MPVLIEAISIVVRKDAIRERYDGGWHAFVERVPNRTLCFDAYIARVGFMSRDDVRAYVDELESFGLRYLVDGEAQDIAVVDQLHGFLTAAPWLEIGKLPDGETGSPVVACRISGSADEDLAVPDRWQFPGSMSERGGFRTDEDARRDLVFVRYDGDLDVFLDKTTGKEVYVGRTSRSQ